MKDGGRMTFLPDLISFRLLAVIIFSQPKIRVISDQEATNPGDIRSGSHKSG